MAPDMTPDALDPTPLPIDEAAGERTAIRGRAGERETVAANRHWWDSEAVEYYVEHGAFLGDDDLVWSPEGVTEDELRLLGDVAGLDVLEFGAGAAQGSRYVAAHGGRVVASDLSMGMLLQAQALEDGWQPAHLATSGSDVDADAGAPLATPLVQADACALPFADASFDLVFSAYGAVPFVADSARLLRECARVLRPGGRLVFSTTHPIRWAFPDVPGEAGLTATMSYFDRTPYTERRGEHLDYAEHHRTMGDRVREITAAGLHLVDLVEPEWPERNTQTWGGWSPLRGHRLPGTAIFVCTRAITGR